MSFADVESANVVGYTQVDIPAQPLTMIGIPFSAINGTAISVQDLFADPLKQGMTGATAYGNADQLQYWDPNETGSYVTLYLNSNTATSDAQKARHNHWCVAIRAPKDTSWGLANNAVSEKKLTPGMGLWLKRKNSSNPITLTMAGQVTVAQDGYEEVACREGLTMISGGFSTGFAPNPDVAVDDNGSPINGKKVDWLSKGCIGATAYGNADQMQFWDPNETGSYVTLYLNSNTATSDAQKARHNHWCVAIRAPKDTSWGSANNAVCPKVIPAGRGIWYKRKAGAGAFTLKLDQPYTLD